MDSTVVVDWSVATRRFNSGLHPVCSVLLVEGSPAGRRAMRGVACVTLFVAVWYPLNNELSVRRGARGHTRGHGVCPVVADNRRGRRRGGLALALVLVLTLVDDESSDLLVSQTKTKLEGQQETAHAVEAQSDLDQRGATQFAVDDGVRHVVHAVDVLVHIDGVLVSAIAEGGAFVEGLDGIDAARAVGGMALEVGHHVLLVGFQAAHDRLDKFNSRRHS